MAADEEDLPEHLHSPGRAASGYFFGGPLSSSPAPVLLETIWHGWKKTPLEALDRGKRQHESIPLLMEHSLEQVSEKARACLGLTGVLAMKPFEA